MYLITELLTGGELLEAVLKRGNYNEDEARLCFVQVGPGRAAWALGAGGRSQGERAERSPPAAACTVRSMLLQCAQSPITASL